MIFAFGGPLRKPLGGLLRRLGAPFDRLETILGHLGRILDGLGVSWSALGLSGSSLGALFGPSWAVLGASWGSLGPSWAEEAANMAPGGRVRTWAGTGTERALPWSLPERVPMPAPSALGSLGGKRFVRHQELCLGALALGSVWRDLLLLRVMVLRAFHVTVRSWKPW